MGIINVLDFSVANLIAAGEVVDRPASAIKELMENAIDAGATKITVETKNGGSVLMRVTDNGCGMSEEDLAVCIRRHATSKIRSAADLDGIMTLGFRGEALAAIASVSKLRIMTRRPGEEMGHLLSVDCGEIVGLEETGAAIGTTVIAEELFANVPARRKFLKKDVSETTAVVAVAEKIALSHPDISIRLITDGQMRFTSAGDGQLWNTIYSVLGRDFSKKLVQVNDVTAEIGVSGFVGRPDNVRGNRNYQNFFINGRYVKSTTAAAALEQAFVSYCPPERFPVCVLNLQLHPALVDVNVHPAKLEVKFSNEKAVFEAVYCAVRNALIHSVERPEAALPENRDVSADDLRGVGDLIAQKLESAEAARQASLDREKLTGKYEQIRADLREPDRTPREGISPAVIRTHPEIPGSRSWQVRPEEPERGREEKERKAARPATSEEFGIFIPGFDPIAAEEDQSKTDAPQKNGKAETGRAERSFVPSETGRPAPTPDGEKENTAAAVPESAVRTSDSDPDLVPLPWYRISGVVFNCYVTVELEDRMLLIDKHAAHERILFEEMKEKQKQSAAASQILLIPIDLPLSPEETEALTEYGDEIGKLGFAFTLLPEEKTVRIGQIPAELNANEASAMFGTLSSALAEGGAAPGITGETLYEKALFQASCKAAVKAGREDDPENIRWIVENVLTRKNVRFCPHGRPVAFEMTKNQVEHLFKRS